MGDRQGPHGHDSAHRCLSRVVLGAGRCSLRVMVVVGTGRRSLRVLLVAWGGGYWFITNVVVCRSVAMSPLATWYLIPMLKNGLRGGDVSAHQGVGHRGHCLTVSSVIVACLIAGNDNVVPASRVNRGGGE